MKLRLTVKAKAASDEKRWARELAHCLRGRPGFGDLEVSEASRDGEPGQIVFVEDGMPGMDAYLAGLDRGGKAVFLLARDGAEGVPAALEAGQVDDVLVHPFRPLEVLSKLRHYQQILMWDEVRALNASFSELVGQLQGDLQLAERLQKSKLPARFPNVKGFGISSRYLAGMKSGGDHFDLAESANGHQLSIVLSDSSSYGLSSAVLSVLMRVTVKLSAEEARSCQETVRRIQDELLLTLSEKDQLSLFYGVVSRKDYRLRYLNLGTSQAFYADPGQGFRALPAQGPSIRRQAGTASPAAGGKGGAAVAMAPATFAFQESEVTLNPEGRLVLLSDGFVEVLGGPDQAVRALDQLRERERNDVLNELVFQVKARFNEPDDLPAQDCTAALFDVGARVIRAV